MSSNLYLSTLVAIVAVAVVSLIALALLLSKISVS